MYDADGRKLQRIYTPEGGTAKKIFYAGRYVYEAETLQYISFEEGRIRATQYVSQSNGYESLLVDGNMALPDGKKGTYDYFIRDYQGNVRMILTQGQHFSSGTATMETARAGVEEPVFGQTGGANEVAQSRFAVSSIPGQAWQHPNIGSQVSRLSKLSQKVGPNSLLKVMAGDEINATTQYFYKAPAGNTNGTTAITEILQSLLQTINGSGATNAVTKSGSTNITGTLNGTTPFRNIVAPNEATVDNTPKAYLTVLFFDERFKFVEEGSTYLRVNSADNSNASLTLAGIKAPKNGYVYVYVSNESDEPVYFDNLQVAHNRGRIVEENHYYAFGLKIAGISSRKLAESYEGNVENKYLYNDKELFEEGDLNWYDYGFRNYDPQIGRFTQLDPLTDDYHLLTPYQYGSNDPIANIDLDGLEGFNALFTGAGTAAADLGNVTVSGVRHLAKAGSSFWSVTGNFLKGLGQSVKGTLSGIYDAVTNPVETAKAIGHAVTHPLETGKAIYKAAENTYHDFINGDADKRANILGNLVGDVAQVFIGTGEAKLAMQTVKASKYERAMLKFGREARESALKSEKALAEVNEKVTKSNLKLGQKMHKAYRANEVLDGVRIKEFRLPSGKRIDFIDIEKGIIYELKPNNPRAIKAGESQLSKYQKELESMPRFKGIKWQTVLDKY